MSANTEPIVLLDAAERERAVETFDRNLVVTAGAGTGKTTLLVDRLVHLLLRNPEPLRVTEIVALTFTNKAAEEMKLRLRDRLRAYLAVDLSREPEESNARNAQKEIEVLTSRYRLSKDDLDRRIHDALRNVERSDIGTIHSFAATLLRLYPLEAGVDPQFQEDDGAQFDRLFDEQWELWLDHELSLQSSHTDQWKAVLGKVTLEHVRALAKSLAAETVEIQRDRKSASEIPDALQLWLADLEGRAASLIERYPAARTNEKLVRAAHRAIGTFGRNEADLPAAFDELRALLMHKTISRTPKGWSPKDIGTAQELVRVAKGLCQVDASLTRSLWELLTPLAARFREFFIREGFISFDGLLIRARNLVRDHLGVRSELKRRYRAILIDEFQDTDPIQYEILLYLGEIEGTSADHWRRVNLAPGKVFVVGDPKQSIYAFRRADMEAYLKVVEKIIKAQGGLECRLTTNFRSNSGILDVVNGAFSRLITPQHGIQPPYIPIHAAAGRESAADSKLPEVTLRKIFAKDVLDAERLRRLEGESLARWLNEEIIGKTEILSSVGERVYAQPKDIAILFRKLTDIHDYLEPFRRYDIRYVVEGERHFYAAKEIIDAVNLLRAIENPYDRLALVGVLRSPLGALTDRQIYDLHRANLLDYRKADGLGRKKAFTALAELYRILARLNVETRLLPVGEAISKIFESLPLKLLAACQFQGEQAVANLEKLRQQAILLGREGSITLKQTIRHLQERVLEIKEESESVLVEDHLDAVRMMSIHKAKGLEFPIVILAGCHSGTEGRPSTAEAFSDWSTELTGMRIGQFWDLPGLFISEKSRLRAEEEQKRVFYVAMTRAREHLIVSCAPAGRRSSGSFLSMLAGVSAEIEDIKVSRPVQVGAGSIAVQVLTQSLTAPGQSRIKAKGRKTKTNWRPLIDAWKKHQERYELAMKRLRFVTPTLLEQQEQDRGATTAGPGRPGLKRERALLVGDLAHRFLQHWDFAADPSLMDHHLRILIESQLTSESPPGRAGIETELRQILQEFFCSPAFAELTDARILGREIPFLMPWHGQIMEGVIDLIYEKDGLLYLADYKTDRIAKEQLTEAAARYRRQATIYWQAVRQSLGCEPAAFKMIFLRLGEVMALPVEKIRSCRFSKLAYEKHVFRH